MQNASSEPDAVYSCERCLKSFERPQYLNRHLLTYHSVHDCDQCDESFSTISLRCEHIKTNHMGENSTYTIRDKTFERKDMVEIHLSVFHNIRDFTEPYI